MSDMALIIEELRKSVAVINDIANQLANQFSRSETQETEKEPVITLEVVRAVLANKSREGYTAQIRSLLQKYGAEKLSSVDPANYKALLADVEELSDAR